MNNKQAFIAALALVACAASGCTSVDRSGLSLNEGKELAKLKTERICSSEAPVGSHMRRVVCRSREVVEETANTAQEGLRSRSGRVLLCPNPAMCNGPQGGNNGT